MKDLPSELKIFARFRALNQKEFSSTLREFQDATGLSVRAIEKLTKVPRPTLVNMLDPAHTGGFSNKTFARITALFERHYDPGSGGWSRTPLRKSYALELAGILPPQIDASPLTLLERLEETHTLLFSAQKTIAWVADTVNHTTPDDQPPHILDAPHLHPPALRVLHSLSVANGFMRALRGKVALHYLDHDHPEQPGPNDTAAAAFAKMDAEELRTKLRDLRRATGLSLDALAEHSAMHPSTLTRLDGHEQPHFTAPTIELLRQILGRHYNPVADAWTRQPTPASESPLQRPAAPRRSTPADFSAATTREPVLAFLHSLQAATGFNHSDISRFTGLSKPCISAFLKGGPHKPTPRTIRAIRTFLERHYDPDKNTWSHTPFQD